MQAWALPSLDFLPMDGDNWQRLEGFRTQLKNFNSRLKTIDPVMIDSFLNDNPTLRDMGRTLIAYEILKAEASMSDGRPTNGNRKDESDRIRKQHGLASVPDFKDNWYRFLVDKMIEGCVESKDLLKNRVKIITFNYDVSLEHYLYTRLDRIDRFETDDIMEFLNNNLITHMYGAIRGNAFEEADYGADFGNAVNHDRQHKSGFKHRLELAYKHSKGIDVIDKQKSLAIKGSEIGERISRDYLRGNQAAQNIFILGFGFYEDNIDILGLSNPQGLHQKLNVFYTNYGNSAKITRRFNRYLSPEVVREAHKEFSGAEHYAPEAFSSERNVYDALNLDFDFSG